MEALILSGKALNAKLTSPTEFKAIKPGGIQALRLKFEPKLDLQLRTLYTQVLPTDDAEEAAKVEQCGQSVATLSCWANQYRAIEAVYESLLAKPSADLYCPTSLRLTLDEWEKVLESSLEKVELPLSIWREVPLRATAIEITNVVSRPVDEHLLDHACFNFDRWAVLMTALPTTPETEVDARLGLSCGIRGLLKHQENVDETVKEILTRDWKLIFAMKVAPDAKEAKEAKEAKDSTSNIDKDLYHAQFDKRSDSENTRWPRHRPPRTICPPSVRPSAAARRKGLAVF